MVSINGQLTKKIPKKKIWTTDFFNPFLGNPVKFVVKRNGVEKSYTITPKFIPSKYMLNKTKKPDNMSGFLVSLFFYLKQIKTVPQKIEAPSKRWSY